MKGQEQVQSRIGWADEQQILRDEQKNRQMAVKLALLIGDAED